MCSFLTLVVSILLLGSSAAATAIPISRTLGLRTRTFEPQPNDPDWSPVNIKDLADDATMTCNHDTFSHDDILNSVQWGALLETSGVHRGKKSRAHPDGLYPSPYTLTKFTFNGNCPADDNRLEFPLVADGPWNAPDSYEEEDYAGKFRVIFYVSSEELAADGNPTVYFCGGIVHQAATGRDKWGQCVVN